MSVPARSEDLSLGLRHAAGLDSRQQTVRLRRWTTLRALLPSQVSAAVHSQFMALAIRTAAKGAERVDSLIVQHRVRAYSIVFIVMGLLTLTAKIVNPPVGHDIGRTVLTDFLGRWVAGRMLLTGQAAQMYDVAAQIHLQRDAIGPSTTFSLYVSPPFVAAIFAPLATLPFALSALIWAGITLALLGLAAWIFRPMMADLRHDWGLILLVCAASEPVFELVGSGQDSALTVLLWIAGIRLSSARRDGWAGLVFAFGLFKPQLFFMPPLIFLATRRYRGFAAWAATAASLSGACVAAFGLDSLRSWLTLLGSGLYQSEVQVGQAWRMQSVPALAQTLVPAAFGPLMGKVGLVLGIAIIAMCLLYARSRPADSGGELALWAMAITTTLLASPHLLAYDLILLAPAAIFLVQRSDRRSVRLALIALLLLTWSWPVRHVIAGNLPWPLNILDASWSAVPFFILWLALRDLVRLRPQMATELRNSNWREGLANALASPGVRQTAVVP